MEFALEAKGLTKKYRTPGGGELVAVDDLSFAVRPGEIVGVLGPNGAGKTTALQLCLKLLHADAGEARLFGLDPEDLAVRRRVGYAPDAALFPKSLTGLQALELHADLLAVPRAKIAPLVEELGFVEPSRRPTATYSRGQLQRLGLAQALLGDPDLLFLDEPTAGLDPAGVAQIRALLVSLRARGAAVVLNSHLLSEVERVCDRVLFVKGGRCLRVHEVNAGGRRAEVHLANAARMTALLKEKLPDGVLDGDRFRIPVAGTDVVPPLVKQLVELGAEILEVKIGGAELEELYLALVEGRS
jgi:ABC-2 type transport system ATP-binding protein